MVEHGRWGKLCACILTAAALLFAVGALFPQKGWGTKVRGGLVAYGRAERRTPTPDTPAPTPEPEVDDEPLPYTTISAEVAGNAPSLMLQGNLTALLSSKENTLTQAERRAATPTFFRPRDVDGDLQDLLSVMTLVQQGANWGLFCTKESTVLTSVQGSLPSYPRCYLHKKRCGQHLTTKGVVPQELRSFGILKRIAEQEEVSSTAEAAAMAKELGGFKYYLYPLLEVSEEGGQPTMPGKFFKGIYAAFDQKMHGVRTDTVRDACVMMHGIDMLLFGNAKGMFENVIDGPAFVEKHSTHVRAYESLDFLNSTNTVASEETYMNKLNTKRPLWGINHLSFGFCDWNIDQEGAYENRAMLPVRTTTSNVTYQRWIDMQVPPPKVVETEGRRLVKASKRPSLMFFSGSVYDFKSPRYVMRLFRDLGSEEEIRVWLYCYDKTKKGISRFLRSRSARKKMGYWDKFSFTCYPESSRSDRDGFFPQFKKRSKDRKNIGRPPEVFASLTAQVYVLETEGATFCPIVRGWALHTYRLTEALYYGCIPVIFTPGPKVRTYGDATYGPRMPVHLVFPFTEAIDWSKCTITLDEDLLYTDEGRTWVRDYLRELKANTTAVDEMQLQGVLAHDLILGGSNLNKSMSIMTRNVVKEWAYRSRLFGIALDTMRLP